MPKGRYRARVQVMFSEYASGEEIVLSVRETATRRTLAECRLVADLDHRERGDENYLDFVLPRDGHVEISGAVERNRDTTLLRLVTVIDDNEGVKTRSDFFSPGLAVPTIAGLREVILGTTGVCNASCVHCPTNKKHFSMAHGRMSDALFFEIVAELKAGGFRGNLFLGLFAEPLEDPNLIDRLKFIRKELPDCAVLLPTNAALFDPVRHAEIFNYVNTLSVHVEAMDPDVYGHLMHPLKLDRVLPKVRQMIDLAKLGGGRMELTTPVHKGNLSELRRFRHSRRNTTSRRNSRHFRAGPGRAASIPGSPSRPPGSSAGRPN